MKCLLLFAVLTRIPGIATAQELKLQPGFTATLVSEGIANARHIAVRGNDIYVSTNSVAARPGSRAIHAIRLGPDHKPVQSITFGNVWGGTGIRIHNGALYAASGTTVWRYALGPSLAPVDEPQAIVTGMQDRNNRNRILEFDESGGLYVALSGDGNNACAIGGRLSATSLARSLRTAPASGASRRRSRGRNSPKASVSPPASAT